MCKYGGGCNQCSACIHACGVACGAAGSVLVYVSVCKVAVLVFDHDCEQCLSLPSWCGHITLKVNCVSVARGLLQSMASRSVQVLGSKALP